MPQKKKKRLKDWSLEQHKKKEEELAKARGYLYAWQVAIENKEFSENDWNKYQEKQKIIMKIMRDAESVAHQKSRIHWLKGDRNMNFCFPKTL